MAVPPPPPHPAKAAVRASLRAARCRFVEALGASGRVAAERGLRARAHHLLARAGPIAGYAALGDEPDILPLLVDASDAGLAIALPRISADRAMTFAGWRPGEPLARGPLGIAQPVATDLVTPAILLMPLLGFDRRGARLGQGGGYYDRWCAAHPAALRIGVAWSVQEVARLPVDAWDMPLHGIVTEQDWIEI